MTFLHPRISKILLSISGYTDSVYFYQRIHRLCVLLSTRVKRRRPPEISRAFTDETSLILSSSDGSIPTVMHCRPTLELFRLLRNQVPNITITAAAPDAPWNDASGTPSTNLTEFADVLDHISRLNYGIYR
ncbi:hypothetical protein C8Q80DRAFT_1322734 [Daedaleopsis nitida]|nr:hypothetical protein C8Q80DRAFT_1322734 [Daedaleopsis nitida]